jgi:hypothetical protein
MPHESGKGDKSENTKREKSMVERVYRVYIHH